MISSRIRWILLVYLGVLCFSPSASAHQVGLSYGEFSVEGPSIQARLKLSPDELLAAHPSLDSNGDGKLDAADLAPRRDALFASTLQKAMVGVPSGACPLTPGALEVDETDGIILHGVFSCPESGPFTFEIAYTSDLPQGHRHLAKVTGQGEVQQFVAHAGSPRFTVEGVPASPLETAGKFGLLGIEHIFTGIDHLLFLMGLLLIGGSLRQMAGIVTSFTVAHSITLILATLNVVNPDPRIVEPAIAASILYVAVENLVAKEIKGRWRLTFAFGLIHGFGFAGVLRELHLPRSDLAMSLVSFNLGVEAGQLCVVVVAVPLLIALRKNPWFAQRGVQVCSLGIGAMGAFWLVQRVFFG